MAHLKDLLDIQVGGRGMSCGQLAILENCPTQNIFVSLNHNCIFLFRHQLSISDQQVDILSVNCFNSFSLVACLCTGGFSPISCTNIETGSPGRVINYNFTYFFPKAHVLGFSHILLV